MNRLTQTQVNALWQRFHATGCPKARAALVGRYSILAEITAFRLRRRATAVFDLDDMRQQGLIGLLAALEAFDPNRGIQFQTFAICKIRGAILEALRTNDWVPRSVREKIKNGEMPPVRMASLEATLPGCDEGLSLAAILPDTEPSPFAQAVQTIEREQVWAAIRCLPAREKTVLVRSYGEEVLIRLVAEELGISESRVHQLRKGALQRIRKRLDAGKD